jgi:hypothetical protein
MIFVNVDLFFTLLNINLMVSHQKGEKRSKRKGKQLGGSGLPPIIFPFFARGPNAPKQFLIVPSLGRVEGLPVDLKK